MQGVGLVDLASNTGALHFAKYDAHKVVDSFFKSSIKSTINAKRRRRTFLVAWLSFWQKHRLNLCMDWVCILEPKTVNN